jgi:hypothetical protein
MPRGKKGRGPSGSESSSEDEGRSASRKTPKKTRGPATAPVQMPTRNKGLWEHFEKDPAFVEPEKKEGEPKAFAKVGNVALRILYDCLDCLIPDCFTHYQLFHSFRYDSLDSLKHR